MKEPQDGGSAERAAASKDATRITVEGQDGSTLDLYVLEETKLNGMFYLLAAESADGDGDCYILKDVSRADEKEAVYEFVTDDAEAEYMLRIFQELVDAESVKLTEETN